MAANAASGRRALTDRLSSLFEEGPCLDQVARSEALGEGCIDASKLLEPRRALLGSAIQLGEAESSPELVRLRPLLSSYLERPPDGLLGLGGILFLEELAAQTMQFRRPGPFVCPFDECESVLELPQGSVRMTRASKD